MAVAHKQRRRQRHRPQANQRVAEIIGRNAVGYAQMAFRSRYATTTVDQTIPDYEFYDKLRRGKQPGYKLGAIFAPRIERVLAAWVFGEGVNVTLNKDVAEQYPEEAVKYTNEQLKNFIDGLLDSGQDNEGDDPDLDVDSGAIMLNIFKDAVGLGDQYPVVNADGSISVPSVDTVNVIRDELDYRRVLAVQLILKTEKVTITDEYRADGRTITTRTLVNGNIVETVETFANLIGRIPVVHVAYGRSSNETNGHSIHEWLLKLYDQYDDVLHKQLDGVKLLGNPILAFTGLEDLTAVIDANKPMAMETYQDQNGNEVNRPQLNIDRNSVLLIGKGGDAKFVTPPVGFTEDTKTALKTLFLLLLDYTGIPESIWGNELSSARASSETQMTQFVKELRGWQNDNGGWVARLCKIWLQYRALTDPKLIVDKLTAEWPAAIEEDKELLLKFLEAAKENGLIQGETMLRLMELVDDPADEVKKGIVEVEARAEQEQERTIALAKATKPLPGRVGEMQTEGYNVSEIAAVFGAAERIVVNGGV